MHEEIKRGVWRHYKDKLYLVLGVAKLCFRFEPFVPLGIARHSETEELLEVGVMSWTGRDGAEARLVVSPGETPPPRPPASRYLVVYVPLYDTGNTQMAVRPVEMWQEEVEVPQETAYTAAKTVKVPRFRLVREH